MSSLPSPISSAPFLDADSPVPLYRQLSDQMRANITHGHWQPDNPIPPERELMDTYGVSRATVRQAIAALAAEGLLYREQGRGTFVGRTRPIVATLSGLTGHIEELRRQGVAAEVATLHVGMAPAPPAACAALGIPTGSETLHVRRFAGIAEGPLVVVDHHLAPGLEEQIDPEELHGSAAEAVLVLLERLGIRLLGGRQQIRATAAQSEEATLLEITPNSPVLEVTRTVYAADGRRGERAVEWSRATYHPDRYQYEIELLRRSPA